MIEKIQAYSNEIKILIYSFFVFLDIDTNIVKILFYLMIIDTLIGVIKTIALNNRFVFKKLLLGFVSKLAIILIPMAVALMGKGLSYDFSLFVTVVLDIIIVSEGISIFSNAIAIKTKKEVQDFDPITKLLIAIRTGLINLFKRFISNIETPNQ